MNKIEAAIKTIKKEEQLRKKTISSLQMDVSKLQRIVDNKPEEGNLLQINKEMVRLSFSDSAFEAGWS